MRQVTIIVPFLVSDPGLESALRALPAGLERMVERGRVVGLSPLDESVTPEAAWLALDPSEVQVPAGPLTVAALGYSPPTGSVHFQLTLCSADVDGLLRLVKERPSESEVIAVFGEVGRLKTPVLTPLVGEGLDHALVWEGGSLEMSAVAPLEVEGMPLLDHAPQGDGEKVLRRFIDDTVNLLDGLELNHVRREEGLPPLNCLWPWGQGVRPDLPNLPLRRGDVAFVESSSMRMEGLCRLAGYRHGNRKRFGTALKTDYGRVYKNASGRRLTVALMTSIEEMQRHGKVDEIVWNLGQLSETVLEPLMENEAEEPFVLRLVAAGGCATVNGAPERASRVGLGLVYESERPEGSGLPFDERVLDDPRVPQMNVWEFIHPGLVGAY